MTLQTACGSLVHFRLQTACGSLVHFKLQTAESSLVHFKLQTAGSSLVHFKLQTAGSSMVHFKLQTAGSSLVHFKLQTALSSLMAGMDFLLPTASSSPRHLTSCSYSALGEGTNGHNHAMRYAINCLNLFLLFLCLLVCMAVSVCCVALSTFPVTELWPVGIRVQRTEFCCLPCPSCTEPSPSSCGDCLPTATDLATRLQTWAGKAEPESRMTGQQPSKRPGPAWRQGNASSGCSSVHTLQHVQPPPSADKIGAGACPGSAQATVVSAINSLLVQNWCIRTLSISLAMWLEKICCRHARHTQAWGWFWLMVRGCFSSRDNLQHVAAFVPRRGVSIRVTGKRKLQVIIRANWTWSMHITTSCLSTQHSNNAQALHSRFYLWANANIT